MTTPVTPPGGTTRESSSVVDEISVATMSDYGTDISLDELDQDTTFADVVVDITTRAASREARTILPSVEFEEGEREDEEQDVDSFVQVHSPKLLRVARRKSNASYDVDADMDVDTRRTAQSLPARKCEAREIDYNESWRQAQSVAVQEPNTLSTTTPTSKPTPSRGRSHSRTHLSITERTLNTPEAEKSDRDDTRPPLERFRTKPKKPLSVTDLVSPAWCELQYLYTLSKFGRKPRTQAMRTGSRIHQELEDQVHVTVPVQVHTNEDRFGLRLWNVISGLRCLRETGLTRELEVWGIIQGQVINGVIDELAYKCPDTAFEEQMERLRTEKSGGIVPLPPGQLGIANAFVKPHRQVYIADVKTRTVPSLPTGASLRPTWMQLMLYRKLLESLSLNTVDAETVLSRYALASLEPFTPTFMQEINALNPHGETSDYPNLLSLWSLLITEMQMTFPPITLSPMLRAEFRYAKTGNVIGSELAVYDVDIIDTYIAEKMAWWQGRRDAKGVEIEEAFKCGICDFAEDCSWRKTKIKEATEKSRLRRQARDKSAV